MRRKLTFPLVLLILASLACNLGGNNVLNNGFSFDVRITEAQLNAGSLNLSADDFMRGAYSVDLQPGKVVVAGDFVRPNGTEIAGTADIGITAENGALQVTILSVNAEGVDISDARIQEIQNKIASGLSQAFQDQDVVRVESVEITDNEIVIKLRGSLPGGQ